MISFIILLWCYKNSKSKARRPFLKRSAMSKILLLLLIALSFSESAIAGADQGKIINPTYLEKTHEDEKNVTPGWEFKTDAYTYFRPDYFGAKSYSLQIFPDIEV